MVYTSRTTPHLVSRDINDVDHSAVYSAQLIEIAYEIKDTRNAHKLNIMRNYLAARALPRGNQATMHKLVSIIFIALLSTAVSGPVYKESKLFGKTYIYHYGQRYSYEHAITTCQSLNATVVQPQSIKEALWMHWSFRVQTNFWIGLEKTNSSALPKQWLDGSLVTVPLWAMDYTTYTYLKNVDEDGVCAVADPYHGRWRPLWCTKYSWNTWPLICEQRLTPFV